MSFSKKITATGLYFRNTQSQAFPNFHGYPYGFFLEDTFPTPEGPSPYREDILCDTSQASSFLAILPHLHHPSPEMTGLSPGPTPVHLPNVWNYLRTGCPCSQSAQQYSQDQDSSRQIQQPTFSQWETFQAHYVPRNPQNT